MEDPSGHLDSSWTTSRSVQISRLGLGPHYTSLANGLNWTKLDQIQQNGPNRLKWTKRTEWTKVYLRDGSGPKWTSKSDWTKWTEWTKWTKVDLRDWSGPKWTKKSKWPKGLVCVTLHITRFMNNRVMWKTLLGTWIPLGLHLDQSKYLGWVWDHTAHNSIWSKLDWTGPDSTKWT